MAIGYDNTHSSGENVGYGSVGISAYSFSAAQWSKMDATGLTTTWKTILDLEYDGTHYIRAEVRENSTTAGNLDFRISVNGDGGGAGTSSVHNSSVTEGSWFHIALVCTAADDYELFLNGSSVATYTSSRNITTGGGNVDTYVLGNRPSALGVDDAKYAYAAIWTADALSGTEITNLQTKTPDNISNNPEFYWSLDDGTLTADIGSDLVETGTSVYTDQSGDNPSLTGPSSGNPHYYYAQQ